MLVVVFLLLLEVLLVVVVAVGLEWEVGWRQMTTHCIHPALLRRWQLPPLPLLLFLPLPSIPALPPLPLTPAPLQTLQRVVRVVEVGTHGRVEWWMTLMAGVEVVKEGMEGGSMMVSWTNLTLPVRVQR